MQFISLLIVVSCLSYAVHGLSVATNPTLQNLIASIFPPNFGISDVQCTISGGGQQFGLYSDFTTVAESMKDGVILSSGDAGLAPNVGTFVSSGTGSGSNSFCQSLVANAPYDQTLISCDFKLAATYEGIRLQFMFGSEEYPQFVGSAFEDCFGVFVNGQNIALDANNNKITINSGFFSSGQVVSGDSIGVAYNGLTPVLQSKTALTPGQNHIDIALCDVGDNSFDSAAFFSFIQGCVSDCETGPAEVVVPGTCGDGTCGAEEETCTSCPSDCGICADVCGDNVCSGSETCKSCPADCMPCPNVIYNRKTGLVITASSFMSGATVNVKYIVNGEPTVYQQWNYDAASGYIRNNKYPSIIIGLGAGVQSDTVTTAPYDAKLAVWNTTATPSRLKKINQFDKVAQSTAPWQRIKSRQFTNHAWVAPYTKNVTQSGNETWSTPYVANTVTQHFNIQKYTCKTCAL